MDLSYALHHQRWDTASPLLNGPKASATKVSPLLELLFFFHKAIRAELERLHQDALAVERGGISELQVLSDSFQFLHVLYVQHSNAEDEIIFPALDSRVKNVAHTYTLEHKEESDLFDEMWRLLDYAFKDGHPASIKLRRELICCTEAIQTTICQHMAKEEEQVFPLLMLHFSFEEQGVLVWQFICSIPVNLMEKFLPLLASSLSKDECEDMIACLHKIIPREELLRQVVFAWLKGDTLSSRRMDSATTRGNEISEHGNLGNEGQTMDTDDQNTLQENGSLTESHEDNDTFGCLGTHSFNLMHEIPGREVRDGNILEVPINELLYWHNAIRKELKEFAEEARKIQLSACALPSNLSSFSDRLQFLAEVCIFHSAAEDKVVFPAVGRKAKYGLSFVSDHEDEERQFDDVRRLLEGVHSAKEGNLPENELYEKLCAQADLIVETVQQHFLDEEKKVLPLARQHCSIEEQRTLLYESLRVMPLKLLEKVLPWLVAVLNEEEVKNMLHNMRLAAPVADTALVTLFSGWACKGHKQCNLSHGKFTCISSNSIDGWCIMKRKLLSCRASCCCEGISSSSLSGEGTKAGCPKQIEERSLKRAKPCDVNEDKQFVTDVDHLKNSDEPCCVPDLGMSSTLHFGAGSTRRHFRNSGVMNGYLGSGLFGWGSNILSAGTNGIARPIDTIFHFHKAIRKDLEYLDMESVKLADSNDEFLRQFTGRFRLLWGLYRAHSNAEDEIVFPALEAKETLHNVSHSYTIDHKHEEELLSDIAHVLSELSHLHANIQADEIHMISEDKHKQDLQCKQRLATRLQGMCKSLHITLEQHIYREELELWPLFDVHFTIAEQDKIVGRIIGTTGAEVLQAMLPWVTTALTAEEQNTMMDTWRQATRNTMFDKWLRAWWKGSPSESPRSLMTEQEEVPESGTEQCLQMIADYLSQDKILCKNQNKEVICQINEMDLGDLNSSATRSDALHSNKETFEGLDHSEVSKCRQVQIGNHQQPSFPTPEGNLLNEKFEDRSRNFKPGWLDIFRMNQEDLEVAIRRVSSDTSLDPRRKAYLMQNLLTSRWIVAQQQHTRHITANNGDDIPGHSPSFHDPDKEIYGCEHYKRNCKLRAACCGMLFTCRFCHDKSSDHAMDRQATKEMMCMRCLEIQPVAQHCSSSSCNGFRMARYYCNICKFFDDENRDIYHCPFCNLCRIGKGLGVDYFHCMTCNACMSMALTSHKCREKGLESNCPICHDDLFTSKSPVKALACGHFMHSICFAGYTYSHYSCPICSKSLGDMAAYFGMLDALLAAEQLPEEYREKRQDILCNDCERKGTAPFHWLYHKCSQCGSYNTRAI